MIVPGAVVFEPLQTVSTLVGFLSSVDPQVGQKVEFLLEPPTALITLEGLLPRVSSQVAPELLVGQELLRTETTGVFGVFSPIMSLLMTVTYSFSIEPFAALGTHELLQVQMRFHVGLVGIFPGETFLTDFTGEGLQPRMYTFPVSKTV